MQIAEYIRTDTTEDALSSLELASDFYDEGAKDDRYWKWFIVALHAGIQGLFALALENGNALLVQKPSVMVKMLSAYGAGGNHPEPHMDNFLKLYKKLQCKENLRSTESLPLPLSSQQELAICNLNELRDEYLHFNAKSWSIERQLIVLQAKDCLDVANFIVFQSRTILWYDQSNHERAKTALIRLHQLLNRDS